MQYIEHFIFNMIPKVRAGESANFLAAPAPTPDFFPKRLRLLVFFFRAAPAPAPKGQKNGSGFPKVKLQKI